QVVAGLDRAGQDERQPQGDLLGNPGQDRGQRPDDVSGGIGERDGRGALLGVDQRQHVGLPGGYVHLAQSESGEQQGQRQRKRGCQRNRSQQQVRRQMGEHHRVQQPDASGQPGGGGE